MKITVTGTKTAQEITSAYSGTLFLNDLDGREAVVLVHSQYGWQDGCRERAHAILINPRAVGGNSGSPEAVGSIVIECDDIIDPMPLVGGKRHLLKYDAATEAVYGIRLLQEELLTGSKAVA